MTYRVRDLIEYLKKLDPNMMVRKYDSERDMYNLLETPQITSGYIRHFGDCGQVVCDDTGIFLEI